MKTDHMQFAGQYRDIDKILELEIKYKNEQLNAYNFRSASKAPISTGQGFFYDTGMLPVYSFYDQFHDKRLLLETELAKANWLRYNTIDGIPSFQKGLFLKIKEFQEYFLENTPEYYKIEPPAIASPFLQFSEILGTDKYIELYDRPEMVHEFLRMITDLIIETYEQLYEIMGFNKFNEVLYLSCYYHSIVMAGDPIICISRNISDSLTEKELKECLVKMYDDTYGKSGIHLILRNISSFSATKLVSDVWNSL